MRHWAFGNQKARKGLATPAYQLLWLAHKVWNFSLAFLFLALIALQIWSYNAVDMNKYSMIYLYHFISLLSFCGKKSIDRSPFLQFYYFPSKDRKLLSKLKHLFVCLIFTSYISKECRISMMWIFFVSLVMICVKISSPFFWLSPAFWQAYYVAVECTFFSGSVMSTPKIYFTKYSTVH